MKKSVFREKSVTQVASPEQLNDYIRVSTPAVWLVLAAIVLLLISVIVWGCLGRVEMHTDTGALEEVAPITFVMN